MTRHAGDSEKNTSGVKTAVTKECQEEGEECTKPDGGRGEPPGGKGGGKRGRGTERDMPPEAATADVCTSVATVGSYTAGSAPRGLGLRPGQSGLRASLASQLRAASVSSSQPTSSSDSVIPVPAWEVARGGLYTLWLDKARSRTDHTARH